MERIKHTRDLVWVQMMPLLMVEIIFLIISIFLSFYFRQVLISILCGMGEVILYLALYYTSLFYNREYRHLVDYYRHIEGMLEFFQISELNQLNVKDSESFSFYTEEILHHYQNFIYAGNKLLKPKNLLTQKHKASLKKYLSEAKEVEKKLNEKVELAKSLEKLNNFKVG